MLMLSFGERPKSNRGSKVLEIISCKQLQKYQSNFSVGMEMQTRETHGKSLFKDN